MTLTPEAVTAAEPTPRQEPSRKPARSAAQPVLEQLFELYPHLFGAEFLPLKLGIFQDLMEAHPELFERDALKLALGLHTRSTRYLQCVAAGKMRHDLQGMATESVAPEHVHHAIMELFRRRQARSQEDLGPKLRRQLIAAFEASGMTRQDYLTTCHTNDAGANLALEEALAERDQRLAKQDALVRTFEASGKTVEEFSDMYGMDPRDVHAALKSLGRDRVL